MGKVVPDLGKSANQTLPIVIRGFTSCGRPSRVRIEKFASVGKVVPDLGKSAN
jgi:hypothetical protein